MGLRADIEADLEETLESLDDFGIAVTLIDPEGVVYNTSANDATLPLSGQVLYDTIAQDEDGNEVIDHCPVVTLRRSSLTRVPQQGENWAVQIPITPLSGADKVTHMLERAKTGGGSIGFVRLYLRQTEQS